MATPLDILNADREAARAYAQATNATRLKKLLAAAQAQLTQRIKDARELKGLDSDSFTVQQARTALAQIKAVTAQVQHGLLTTVVDAGHAVTNNGVTATLDYLKAVESQNRGTARPTLGLNIAKVYDRAWAGTNSSILNRLGANPNAPQQTGILQRYGHEVIKKFEEHLQLAAVTAQPWGEVRKSLIDSSPFLQQSPAFWAERIVRTETMAANNTASYEALQEIDTGTGGGMIRILSAVRDNRTGADSLAIHGQIRGMFEPFDHWDGLFMNPPNRPNDREIVVPHHMEWEIPEALQPVAWAEVVLRWNAEGRKGAPPPRPKITTIPLDTIGKPFTPQLPAEPGPRLPPPEQRDKAPLPGEELAAQQATAPEETGLPFIESAPIAEPETGAQILTQMALKNLAASTVNVGEGYVPADAVLGLKIHSTAGMVDLWTAATSIPGVDKSSPKKPPAGVVKSTKFLNFNKLSSSGIEAINHPIAPGIEAEIHHPSKQPIVLIKKDGKTTVVAGIEKLTAKKLKGHTGFTATIYDFDAKPAAAVAAAVHAEKVGAPPPPKGTAVEIADPAAALAKLKTSKIDNYIPPVLEGPAFFKALPLIESTPGGPDKNIHALAPSGVYKHTGFLPFDALEEAGVHAITSPEHSKVQGAIIDSGSGGTVFYKKDGKYVLVGGENNFAAAKLLGLSGVHSTVFDHDNSPPKFSKDPVVHTIAPNETEAVVLGQQIGGQGGSNPGGIFRGTDGVDRYVKFYKDPAQASCEHLANKLYEALGLGSLKSSVMPIHEGESIGGRYKGQLAYTSEMLKGADSLYLNEEFAKEFVKGFAADALLGNWDALGASIDNIVRTPDGKVVRVDNGGSLLMRAQNGRKPASTLSTLDEIDNFFNPAVNANYARAMSLAGYSNPKEFAEELSKQFKQIEAVRVNAGGWSAFIKQHAPFLSTDDAAAVEKMLEDRSSLFRKKITQLTKTEGDKGKPITVHDFHKLPAEHIPHSLLFSPLGTEDPETKHTPTQWDHVTSQQAKSIPERSKAWIGDYTGDGYTNLRRAAGMTKAQWIAEGNPAEDYDRLHEGLAAIQKAFDHNKKLAEQGAPRPEDDVKIMFRGLERLTRGKFEDLINSPTYEWHAPTSTSWCQESARNFYDEGEKDYAVMLVITPRHVATKGKKSTRGVSIESISSLGTSEHEILFPKGSTFKVNRVVRDVNRLRSAVVYITET